MANKLNNLTIFKRNVSNNNEQVNRAISDIKKAMNSKIVAHNKAVAEARQSEARQAEPQAQAKKHKVIINKSVILNNVNVI
jgi:hypothetical protein